MIPFNKVDYNGYVKGFYPKAFVIPSHPISGVVDTSIAKGYNDASIGMRFWKHEIHLLLDSLESAGKTSICSSIDSLIRSTAIITQKDFDDWHGETCDELINIYKVSVPDFNMV
jgi:hypothetical protein